MRPHEPPRARVLIVDDNEDAREIYARVLASAGFQVEQAAGGIEGLQRGLELGPDLIVMDLFMPGGDGWQLIRDLRSDERTRHTPVLVVTANRLAEGDPELRKANCDGLLLKPVLPAILLRAVRDLLDARSGSS
jgi:CheY-like chemotaxis protein